MLISKFYANDRIDDVEGEEKGLPLSINSTGHDKNYISLMNLVDLQSIFALKSHRMEYRAIA